MVKYSLGRLAIIFFVSIIAIVFIVDELEDTIVYHERSERFEFSDGETHAYQYTIKEERTLYVVLVETSCYFSDWSASYMVKDDEGHGFYNEENQFDFYRSMGEFLDKYLK